MLISEEEDTFGDHLVDPEQDAFMEYEDPLGQIGIDHGGVLLEDQEYSLIDEQ